MTWESKDRLTATERSSEPVLDNEMKKAIGALCTRYPTRRAVLLPALHMVQDKFNCISESAILELAELLDIPPAEVLSTASFYDSYSLSQRGKHLIAVCQSLSCELCGCEQILAALQEKLGIEPGQTTQDGKFTLITAQCLGACDYAPAILIDQTLYKNISLERLDDIIQEVEN